MSLLFVILNLLDCALTQTLLAKGMVEINPLCQGQPMWVKLVLAVFFATLLRQRKSVMAALNIGMGAVVLWNLGVLCLFGSL